jgi:hypothetical protein
MQPGISRAVPMGILGFLIGALLVIVVRGLQSLDPLWAVGPGIVFGAFFCAGFFMWGIGAFDPRMSVHGEHAEAEAAPEVEKPTSILGGYVWQVTFLVLVMLVILAVVAWLPGGPTLQISSIPGASARSVGMVDVTLPFGGPVVTVSYLVIFVIFIAWVVISLYIAAGILAKSFNMLDKYTKEAKAEGKPGYQAPALVAVDESQLDSRQRRTMRIRRFITGFPALGLRLTGHIAAITARILRGVPKHLQ